MSRRGRRGAFLGSVGRAGIARWSTLYGAAPADVMLVIDQPVLLDIDALVHGLEVEGAGQLIFDPNSSRLLRVDQQRPVCVMDGGHLEMVPASASIVHELRFIDVDESLYTEGGGMNHTANPGLCVENGTVDLRGAAKTGWTRTTGALLTGATSCTVVDASGWRIGDEIVITPTEAASVTNHFAHFDRRTITNVVGNTISFAATTYPHPSNTTPLTGVIIYPEVLNLTRNVKIRGQDATHRAQIMFMEDCTGSTLEYFEGQYLGPRKMYPAQSPQPMLILGRYSLHFHLMAEGSRGLNVTGVTMHDCGSRGFVPHGSHGMTFYDCVAWEVFSEGYWWDPTNTDLPNYDPVHETDDLLYDHCFAGAIRYADTAPGGLQNAGFHMGTGHNMTCRNCCVAAAAGAANTAGYIWPEDANGANNLWTHEDNDCHNLRQHGIFIWQNDSNSHLITRFRGWNNDSCGIKAGAYANVYHYNDVEVWGNGDTDFALLALSRLLPPGRKLEFVGGGIPLLSIADHAVQPNQVALFLNVAIDHVHVNETHATTRNPGFVDFVDCGIDPDDFEVVTMFPPSLDVETGTGSIFRVQLGASAWEMRTTDGFEAIITPIPVFYP